MYKRELKKNGVRVYSVLENLDDSPESIMMEAMLEGMSEYYSKNLSREVMKGMYESALKCTHLGGLPPLGFDVGIDKRLVTNEREAEAVKIIFKLYDLDYGYDQIIRELNKNGYHTKLGKPFAKNSIYGILTNEKYAGVYVFNKSVSKDMFDKRNTHAHKEDDQVVRIPGGCPRIIEQDMFERVKAKMVENKKMAGTYKAKEIYLFSGLMKCGLCGRAMHGNARHSGRSKLKHVTYRCPNKKHYCSNKEINKLYIEEFVVKELSMYKRELKKNGVRVYSVLENLDDSPESIMMEAMLEGMSEYYSKNLSREVMKGMFESARKCTHLGGLPPLGFDVGADKRLKVNEHEANSVKIIFELYDLDYGYDHIICELNRNGYKTKLGRPFAKNSIYSILTNEKYSGVYVFNNKV